MNSQPLCLNGRELVAWEICASLKLDDGTVIRPGDTVACRLQGRPYAHQIVRMLAATPGEYYYVVLHLGAEMYWPVNRALPLRQFISAYPRMPGRPLILSLCAGIAYVDLFMSHRLGEVWLCFCWVP